MFSSPLRHAVDCLRMMLLPLSHVIDADTLFITPAYSLAIIAVVIAIDFADAMPVYAIDFPSPDVATPFHYFDRFTTPFTPVR